MIHIPAGDLVGVVEGQAVSFKNIPFAAAPVGPLRWAPPKPAPAWKGQRDATAFGPACPQVVYPLGRFNLGSYNGPTSEDCLNLNVVGPKGAHGAPVMVWLYGGGNVAGANSVASYNATSFARDGVIVVSINNRLGALGFFAHPALTRAAKPGEPLGSYGVMDQIAALKWVQSNITTFGGDPKNVTLFGESAGGEDVLTLLATPAAKGLFQRAMVESGGGWSAPVGLSKAEADGLALAGKLGLPADATVEQLRALPVDVLVNAAGRYGPIVDGRLMKESATQTFARGDNIHVPLIIGSNSFEASLMQASKVPASDYVAKAPAELRAVYAQEAPDDASLARALFTDQVMGAPARWIAGKSSAGAPTWLYYFSYVRVQARAHLPGANHASEVPYVFDSQDLIPVYSKEIVDEDRAVAKLMHSCVVGFAKTGAPACNSGQAWPAYTPAGDQLLEFGRSTGVRTHLRKPELDAVEQNQADLLSGQ
jgi:para-nitrobenzyl esterase